MLIQVWKKLNDDNLCFGVNYAFNKNRITSPRLQINDMKLLQHMSHFTHYIPLILTMRISLAAWRQRHFDFGFLPLSPAGIRAAVLRGSIALFSEVPRPGLWRKVLVNPAVHCSLLGNFQGTVEACQHPLLFQHTCIHTLFNSSAQNTKGWKKK